VLPWLPHRFVHKAVQEVITTYKRWLLQLSQWYRVQALVNRRILKRTTLCSRKYYSSIFHNQCSTPTGTD